MKRKVLYLLLLLALPILGLCQWTPTKTNQLVNDYGGLMSMQEQQALEMELRAFNDSTSNQILVVTTNTLEGDEIMNTAQRIGETWGVGKEEFDNCVVILIMSSATEGNKVAIATGYGIEGALPDLFCKRIMDEEMIPHFKHGHYYEGVKAGLEIIKPVMAGEYDFEAYREAYGGRGSWVRIIFFVLGLIVISSVIAAINKYGNNDGSNGGRSGGGFGPTIFFGSPFPGGGGFSGGGSGMGGFGGFGGGSFGGGGSSSSW